MRPVIVLIIILLGGSAVPVEPATTGILLSNSNIHQGMIPKSTMATTNDDKSTSSNQSTTNATYQFVASWDWWGTVDGHFNFFDHYSPVGVAVDSSGYVYVTDSGAVKKFTSSGQFVAKWNMNASGRIAADATGNVYAVPSSFGAESRVEKYTSTGVQTLQWYPQKVSPEVYFIEFLGVAVDSQGVVYVTQAATNPNYHVGGDVFYVCNYTGEGKLLTQWTLVTDGFPYSQLLQREIAVDGSGNIYIAMFDEIQKYTSAGSLIAQWEPFSQFTNGGQLGIGGIAADKAGDLFVTARDLNQIWMFSNSGQVLTRWGSSGTGDGQFDGPSGLAVDLDGNVYVADTGNHRIQKFSPPSVVGTLSRSTTMTASTISSSTTTVPTQFPNPKEPIRALVLGTDENSPTAAVIDPINGFAYFVVDSTPLYLEPITKIVKVRLSDFSRIGELELNPDLKIVVSLIDPSRGYAYFGGNVYNPQGPSNGYQGPVLIRVRLSDFTYAGALKVVEDGEIDSGIIDIANGFALLGVSNAIVRINLLNFTLADRLTLYPNETGQISSALIDAKDEFAYFVISKYFATNGSPSSIIKIRLSDFTRNGTFAFKLEDGAVLASALDVTSGIAYFKTSSKLTRLRLSDLVRLDDYEDQRGTACSRSAQFGSVVVGIDFLYVTCPTEPSSDGLTHPNEIVKIRLTDFTFAGSLEFTGDHASSVVSTTGAPLNVGLVGPMILDEVQNYLFAEAYSIKPGTYLDRSYSLLKVPVTAVPTGLPDFRSRPPLYVTVDYPRQVSEGALFSINVTLPIDDHDTYAWVYLGGNSVLMFFYIPYAYPVGCYVYPAPTEERKVDVSAACTFTPGGKSGDERIIFGMNAPGTAMVLSFNVSADVNTDIGYGLSQRESASQVIRIFVGNVLEEYAFPIVVLASGIVLGLVIGTYLYVSKRLRIGGRRAASKFCESCGRELSLDSSFCDRCGRSVRVGS
jgi:hypothetical protein